MTRTARTTAARASVGALAALALVLTGCSAPSGEDGDVEIRFSWWGTDERAAITEEVVADFEAANPGITVVTEPTAFDGYFDRIATSTAAGDAPDVITLGGAYPLEYAARGALLDLQEVDGQLDTSGFDQTILGNAIYEGGLYGVPTGANTVSIIANTRIFEEAGVPLPDDDTWTWDDFLDITTELSANSPDGVFGFEPHFYDFDRIWLAQRGSPLYTEDGGFDADLDAMEEYWDFALEMRDSGAIPSAELINEVILAAPEQTLLAQGRSAMLTAYSNQIGTFANASGDEMVLLRFPGETEFERPGMTLLPSQYYSISAGTDHPEEAALLIDYLVNSVDAGAKILTDRGLPSNAEVRASITDDLDEFAQLDAAFIDRIAESGGEALPPQPAGASIHNDLTIRLDGDVLYGRLSPADAAAQWGAEMESALGG